MTEQNNGKKYVSPYDFEKYAKEVLTNNSYTYYRSGACDEITLKDCEEAFKKIKLKPRVLRDVNNVDTSTTILGKKISMPLGIAPTAFHKMAHKDGESGTAKAALKQDLIFTLSTIANSSIPEVSKNIEGITTGLKWFQLYVTKDRNISINLIKQAEKYGFEAIVLTIDVPVWGKREGDERGGFKLPSNLNLEILSSYDKTFNSVINSKQEGSGLSTLNEQMAINLWEDIYWIKQTTKLPLILKGIMCAEDALLAVKYGVDAIWVSAHGARQLDTLPATIDVLEEICDAVRGMPIEVYLDGGIRRGTDILKALCLGAKCVFIGRLPIFALACEGEQGVIKLLEMLKDEFKKTMQLMGIQSVKQMDKSFIIQDKQKEIYKMLQKQAKL